MNLVKDHVGEYQGIRKLEFQTFKAECDSEIFWSHIAKCDLRSTKFVLKL